MTKPKVNHDYHSYASERIDNLIGYASWLIQQEEEQLQTIQNRHARNIMRERIDGMAWLLTKLRLHT